MGDIDENVIQMNYTKSFFINAYYCEFKKIFVT